MSTRVYALPVAHVIETMRPLPVTPALGAPPSVTGVAMIRGAATPVVDLAAVVTGTPARAPARFVTLRVGARVVAIAVDGVIGVRELDGHAVAALPPLVGDAAALAGIGALDADFLLVLRTASLAETGLEEA